LKGVVSYAVNMTQSPVMDPDSLPNFLFSGPDAPQYREDDATRERRNYTISLKLFAIWNGS